MISRFERFSFSIAEIYRYWHKIAADEMEKYELKGPYAVYLIALHRNADGLTATQLSDICGKDKSDVSRAVSAMVKRGLAAKESVNQNLYRARIRLTEKGIEAAEHVSARAIMAVDLAGSGISEADRAVFYRTLEHIAANLETISSKGLPLR